MHMNAEDVEAILERKTKFNIFKVTFKKSVDVLTTDRHNIFGSGSPVKGFFYFFEGKHSSLSQLSAQFR